METVKSWNLSWNYAVSEPYKDANDETWINVKFSRPDQTTPIPKQFVFVRLHMDGENPKGYLIEHERTEKPISFPITDRMLEMYIGMKKSVIGQAYDLGIIGKQ